MITYTKNSNLPKLAISAALGLLLAGAGGGAFAGQTIPESGSKLARTVQLQFVNTDISDVLQAISMKTHASVVYSAQAKRPISLNISATSVSEAIGFAASAAGLTYREIKGRYFVAPASDLKQLIEAFGSTETVDLGGTPAADAVTLLTGALPYLTVRPAGNRIILSGDPTDIQQAKTLLAGQVKKAPVVMVSEVVALKQLSAEQTASMIHALYPEMKAEGTSTASKMGGAVGLYGSAADVKAAKDTILRLDSSVTAPAAPGVVYRVYRVKYVGANALKSFLKDALPAVTAVPGPDHSVPAAPLFRPLSGASSTASSAGGSTGGLGGSSNMSSPGGGSGGSGGTGGAPSGGTSDMDRAASLVLSGKQAEVDAALKLLEQLDIAPPQVMIEVKVVDASPQLSQSVGVSWNWSPLTAIETPNGTPITTGSGAIPTITTPATRPMPFGFFSRVPESIQAVLNALDTSTDSKILANPKIQVLDRDDANIFIGDTLRTQVSQSGISGSTVQVYEFPIGIILLVRPWVNSSNEVTLRIHPVVSTITAISSGNLPQTSTREAETVVRVKDGQTMVIGGLIRDEMSKVVQSVPLLSRLPLVGELFKNRTNDHRHSEIMVFITPHIIHQ
jgi:type II secretory pathway component GspD/PulD (secretin)